MCFLVSRAQLFGFPLPLAVSYMAADYQRGGWGLLNLFSCVCGYLSCGQPFAYIIATTAFYVLRLIEKGRVIKNRFTASVYAGGCVLLTGLCDVWISGGYLFDLLSLFVSTAAAAMGVQVFAGALNVLDNGRRRRFLQQEEIVSVSAMFALVFLGLPLGRIGYVSPASVICIVLVLMFSVSGKVGISSAAGIVCGFLLGSDAENLFSYIGTLGFCGLLGGIFGKFGKSGACCAFVLGSIINSALADSADAVTLKVIDTAVAVLIFAFIPHKVVYLAGISKPSSSEESLRIRDAFRDKFSYVSEAFFQLSSSISFFNKSQRRKNFDRFGIYDRAADEICRDCALSSLCWQKYYNDTYETMMLCFREVEKKGEVTVDFLPDYFLDRCEDCEGFIKSINRSYETFKNELVWQDRLSKSHELSAGRFGEAAKIVEKLCDDIDESISFNEELAKGCAAAIEKQGIKLNSVSVFKNPYGRYEIKVKCPGCGGRGRCESMEGVLSEIMECAVEKTAGDCKLYECAVTFSEAGAFNIEHSVRGIPRIGEVVSGDNAVAYTMPDGNIMLAVSDGRGNGAEANLQSSETLRLLCKLMNAGFASDTALRLANTAMAVQTDEEQFATVDVAVINTVTASAVFVKNGACSTFIKRGAELIEIKCDQLPVGVGTDFEATEKYAQLKDGDIIIMTSDGITDAFLSDDELKSEIMSINRRLTVDEITSHLINAAVSCSVREEDDMTVIAAKISTKC